jgi:hypothetical protein
LVCKKFSENSVIALFCGLMANIINHVRARALCFACFALCAALAAHCWQMKVIPSPKRTAFTNKFSRQVHG